MQVGKRGPSSFKPEYGLLPGLLLVFVLLRSWIIVSPGLLPLSTPVRPGQPVSGPQAGLSWLLRFGGGLGFGVPWVWFWRCRFWLVGLVGGSLGWFSGILRLARSFLQGQARAGRLFVSLRVSRPVYGERLPFNLRP